MSTHLYENAANLTPREKAAAHLLVLIEAVVNGGGRDSYKELAEMTVDTILAAAPEPTAEPESCPEGCTGPALLRQGLPSICAECDRDIHDRVSLYRCAECGLPFHLSCIRKHFANPPTSTSEGAKQVGGDPKYTGCPRCARSWPADSEQAEAINRQGHCIVCEVALGNAPPETENEDHDD